LTFGLIKSPHNCLSDSYRDGWGFDKLIFPNGGAIEFLLGQIPTHCPRGDNGCITLTAGYSLGLLSRNDLVQQWRCKQLISTHSHPGTKI